jgi:cytochrome c oxidase subunit II
MSRSAPVRRHGDVSLSHARAGRGRGKTARRGGVPVPRRIFLASLLAAIAACLVLASGAGADAVTPDAGPTQNAVDTDTLYKIVFYIGLGVIALVWGILFWSLFRYRARRGRTVPAIRGNTPLEIGWTVAAGALVTVIAVVTLFYLDDIKNPLPSAPAELAEASRQNAAINQPTPAGALEIKVSGQQYLWRYQYPNGAVSFHDMVVPKDTTVTLQISSNDVAHSWWIPELGGKFDAIRGLDNETWFKATRTGVFEGQCAELCGANHAFMTAKVIVVEPDRYEQWVEDQKRMIEEAQKEAQEQKQRLQSGDEAAGAEQGASAASTG